MAKKTALEPRAPEEDGGGGGALEDASDVGAGKVDPAAAADDAIAVLPNRFSLELTSHLSHVLSLPGGHVVVGGRGGVGRRAAARLAARLSGLSLLEVCWSSKKYYKLLQKNPFHRVVTTVLLL